jgi:hypothetical protein
VSKLDTAYIKSQYPGAIDVGHYKKNQSFKTTDGSLITVKKDGLPPQHVDVSKTRTRISVGTMWENVTYAISC